MSNNLPQEIENKEEFIKEFFAIQQQEIAIKRDELTLRQEENKLNQEVALASIASQEKVELKRGDVFLSNQKGRFWLWGCSALILAVVICMAMYLDKTDIAIRIVEITGAVLLGFFAGINRGKAQILEQITKQQNNE